METNINDTVVGAFVIILIAGIVLGIVWLSSGITREQYTNYMVLMRESVSGLTIDAPVEFNGVNVGTVTSIQLNHQDPQLVEILLHVKSNTPITQGTSATLTTRGVTGITYMSLKDKSTDLRPLTILPGKTYPIIASAPSFFMRIDTALNKLSANLERVTEAIQAVLNPENQRAIKYTLSNIAAITNTLARNTDAMNTFLRNSATISHDLLPLMHSSLSAMQLLETQTLPATYQLLGNLNDVTRNLNGITLELKQNPSILLRGKVAPKLGPGETP